MIISTLEDVERYTREVAEQKPTVADRVVLRSPGLGPQDIARLRAALPGLSDAYVAAAVRYELADVDLGFISIGPRPAVGQDFVEALIAANNGDDNPLLDVLAVYELYEVGYFESDPICLVRATAPERAGEVLWVDPGGYPDVSVMPLSPDFESFIITAARLSDAIGRDVSSNDVFGDLELDTDQSRGWKELASAAGL